MATQCSEVKQADYKQRAEPHAGFGDGKTAQKSPQRRQRYQCKKRCQHSQDRQQ